MDKTEERKLDRVTKEVLEPNSQNYYKHESTTDIRLPYVYKIPLSMEEIRVMWKPGCFTCIESLCAAFDEDVVELHPFNLESLHEPWVQKEQIKNKVIRGFP